MNKEQTLQQDAKVIGLVATAHGVSHFSQLLLASLFPWLKVAFDLSYAQLGLLMTVFFIVSGVGQALAGFVVDKAGARTVLFAGLACLGTAALAMSLAPNYGMLLAGSMLAGLGNCVFHPSDFTLLNQRVSLSRLGHAFSVHGISGNLGWAAAPIFMTAIAAAAGWRVALFSAGLVAFAVLALLWVYRAVLATPAAHPAASHQAAVQDGALLDFMRLPSVWLCFAFFLITALALGGIQSFSSSSLRALYGMSLPLATAAFTAFMLASAAGMVLGGFLAARASRHDRTIALAFTFSGAMALIVATGAVPVWAALVLMGMVGLGAGVAGPSRDLLIRASAPKNATGRVYGVVYSGLDAGVAIAPLLFGALMDASRPAWVFICIGLFQMLAIVTAINVGNDTSKRAAAAPA
ncbi:MFS transporter [Herminiimonas sp. CN]|uniref:MFS transporter n=1 Tax=Herminiimonas sp. CN TaxID=1349818 RepID=UPI000473FD65|nr:MFS transporter [Herminiimonas sp. CN]